MLTTSVFCFGCQDDGDAGEEEEGKPNADYYGIFAIFNRASDLLNESMFLLLEDENADDDENDETGNDDGDDSEGKLQASSSALDGDHQYTLMTWGARVTLAYFVYTLFFR